MDPEIEKLRARQDDAALKAREILARIDREERTITPEEQSEVTALVDEAERLQTQIEQRERLIAVEASLNASVGRKVEPSQPAAPASAPTVEVERPAARAGGAQRPAALSAARTSSPASRSLTFGFNHLGEFANAVMHSRTGNADAKLAAAASEETGSGGGFLVPPGFRNAIYERMLAENPLWAMCDVQTPSSNSISYPADDSTPWGSTGPQAYNIKEGGEYTDSSLDLSLVEVKLAKKGVLMKVTDELLEDAPALSSYLERKAPEKLNWKIDYEMVWGRGTGGEMLGFMNSAALVTQAAEAGPQTAGTIVSENINKMYSRIPDAHRRRALWLINPDAEPQLPELLVGTIPAYLPGGTLANASFDRLRNRQVVASQLCKSIGTLGDIIFFDPMSYLIAMRTDGVRQSVSMHLYFDTGQTAFRWDMRVGGLPWWRSTVAPLHGSTTLSPFVALAAR